MCSTFVPLQPGDVIVTGTPPDHRPVVRRFLAKRRLGGLADNRGREFPNRPRPATPRRSQPRPIPGLRPFFIRLWRPLCSSTITASF